jgi:lipopolysaccharide biosynthesis glycosyltransferase
MTINVAYSCNEAYLHHTGISIISLLENNQLAQNISIFFIQKNVKESSIILLTKLVERYGRQINIISFDDLCFDLKTNSQGRHVETIYAKLFFERIDEIDKILYIDSDTVVNASLQELWEIDLKENLIAGVETYTPSSKGLLKLSASDRCINDGVTLINVKEFRKQHMLEKFLRCIVEYNGNPPVLSEGVINKVCKGKIQILHPKFNLMSGLINYRKDRFANMIEYYDINTINEAINAPVIIHFLAAFYNRPWDINCTHPMKDIYLYYKSKSFWKDFPLENKKMSKRLRIIRILYKILPNDFLDFIQYLKSKKNY